MPTAKIATATWFPWRWKTPSVNFRKLPKSDYAHGNCPDNLPCPVRLNKKKNYSKVLSRMLHNMCLNDQKVKGHKFQATNQLHNASSNIYPTNLDSPQSLPQASHPSSSHIPHSVTLESPQCCFSILHSSCVCPLLVSQNCFGTDVGLTCPGNIVKIKITLKTTNVIRTEQLPLLCLLWRQQYQFSS